MKNTKTSLNGFRIKKSDFRELENHIFKAVLKSKTVPKFKVSVRFSYDQSLKKVVCILYCLPSKKRNNYFKYLMFPISLIVDRLSFHKEGSNRFMCVEGLYPLIIDAQFDIVFKILNKKTNKALDKLFQVSLKESAFVNEEPFHSQGSKYIEEEEYLDEVFDEEVLDEEE